MGKRIWMSFALLFVCACATTPQDKELPKYSYVDSLRTAKKINCASRKPIDCMACALQGEAANQPSRGIYAVGVTIMTRAKGNIQRVCKVTKARRQFEGMRSRGHKKISKKVWGITEHIMKNKETGWTHFWAPHTQYKLKRKKPYWAHQFEKRQCKKEKIGDHIFFNTNQCKLDRRLRLNAQM
jgi:spore germination cell wall hydrolase CwlJ-like protein